MSLSVYILYIFLILWTKATETVKQKAFLIVSMDNFFTKPLQYSTVHVEDRAIVLLAPVRGRKQGERPMSGSASSEKVSPLLSRERKNSCAATQLAYLLVGGGRGRYFSQDSYICTPRHTPPQSTPRVEMADFCRRFHYDGKISPGW
jgi:hypothetical protein